MSRNLSQRALNAIFSQETDEEFLMLLAISQAQLSENIYLVGHNENIWSGGIEYLAAGFRITLPQEREDRPPEVSLEIDNVDRVIVDAVRIATSSPSITLSVVLQTTPNRIEAGPFGLTLRSVTWDALVVSGRLSYEALLDEQYPSGTFTPTEFPGLFTVPLILSLGGYFL
jgi:hypothetical protein